MNDTCSDRQRVNEGEWDDMLKRGWDFCSPAFYSHGVQSWWAWMKRTVPDTESEV